MEGIIFKGFVLTKDEFIQVYKSEVGQRIISDLNQDIGLLLDGFETKTGGVIFSEWAEIQKKYFFPTTILAVSVPKLNDNFDPISDIDKYEFSAQVDETAVIGKNDIIFKKIMEYKQITDVEEALRRHYLSMLLSIQNNQLSKEEAQQFHIYLYYQGQKLLIKKSIFKNNQKLDKQISRNRSRQKEHYTGKSYNVIYGGLANYSKEGKQLDAFMNHMGAHHPDIFSNDNSLSIKAAQKILTLGSKSVFAEEGNHFFNLLLESLNVTPWYASGDIVVIDEYGQVLYNIQLKSSQSMSRRFSISKTLLQRELKQYIQTYANQNLDESAEKIYNILKTNTANDIGPREEDFVNNFINYLSQQLHIS